MTFVKTFVFIFTLAFFSGCSFYSSAGRKQFEEKAPAQIQSQAFAALGCSAVSEFPSSYEQIVERTSDREVWKKSLPQGEVEIRVFSSDKHEVAENCLYRFASEESWQNEQSHFLSEVLKPTADLD
jgi:hypothetical protein